MKEELKNIALELKKWAKKYNKNYIDIAFINNGLLISPKSDDNDREYLEMFIEDREVQNED